MIIYLDLDGVSVDFVAKACRALGRDYDEGTWPAGEYDIAKVLGIGEDEFWEVIHSQGVDFWRRLKPYSWFPALHDALCSLGRVYFVTAPTHSPYSAAGKMLWLKDRFGNGFKDFVITRKKHLLSLAGSVLIDDCDRNISAFEKHGQGKGILFPQRWNSAHAHVNDDRVDYVMERIRRITGGFSSYAASESTL